MKGLPLAAAILGCISAVATTVLGEEPRSRLRLSDVLEEARQQNPQIRAARERQRAAQTVPARVYAYDDPTFGYEAWNAPESFRLDRADNNIFKLSQKIPFPGKRTAARDAAEHDSERARDATAEAEIEVIAAVKEAYYDLWHTRRKLEIYSRDKELVERVARIAVEKYAVGQVAQSDALRAQVELTRVINRVTTESLAIESARAGLAALLSRDDDEPLGAPEDPPPPRLDESVDALVERALRDRPELRARHAAVEREEAKVRMAKLDYLPDFEFSLSRFVNFESRDGFGATASVSIPFAFKHKVDAALAEAGARLSAARADLERFEDRARREVKQGYLKAKTALVQHDLFVGTHVPQAEQAFEAADIGYRTGKLDFLSLVESLREVEMVHLEHIEAAADFEKAMAELERAVGGELPRTPSPEAAKG